MKEVELGSLKNGDQFQYQGTWYKVSDIECGFSDTSITPMKVGLDRKLGSLPNETIVTVKEGE